MKTDNRKLTPVSIYLGISLGYKFRNWMSPVVKEIKRSVRAQKNNNITTNVLINMFNRINKAIDAGASDKEIANLYKEEMIFIDIYQEEMLPKNS